MQDEGPVAQGFGMLSPDAYMSGMTKSHLLNKG